MAHMKSVGQYVERFNILTNQTLPLGAIFQSDGLAVHVMKRHPSEIGNLSLIPAIISNPDYVGKNPREPDSIELVKLLADNVMVCVKLDHKNGYLFVASVYNITNSKLQQGLQSGRLQAY